LPLLSFGCSSNTATKPPVTEVVPRDPDIMNAVIGDSLLTMTAVKDGNIPVKGSLVLSQGRVQKTSAGDWQLVVGFDPKSFNTGLPLRDQRVRDIFFQVATPSFDAIRFESTDIADAVVQSVKGGVEQALTVKGTLFFAGQQKEVSFQALLKLENGLISVTNQEPILISIAAWGLEPAKQALMLVCNHREIQDAVQVAFSVKFE